MTPSDTLNFRLHTLVYSLDQIAKMVLKKNSSINLPQFLTMLCFYENPGRTQKFAAAWLQLTEATVSHNLKKLRVGGYLEIRSGNDARTKNVFLTPKGDELIKSMYPRIEKALASHFDVIHKVGLLEMQKIIYLIYANIKNSFREDAEK